MIPSMAESSDKPDCRSLRETLGTRPRWLSIPESRLVMNPAGGYDFLPMKPPVAEGLGLAFSTNLAYWVGKGEPAKLPMFWSWQPVAPGSSLKSGFIGESIDLLDDAVNGWHKFDVDAVFNKDGVDISLTRDGFGHLEKTLELDLDKTPFVMVDVQTTENARWALKVNDGTLESDAYLKGDTSESGDLIADIRAATGWHGRKKLSIKLFAVGSSGGKISCSMFKCIGMNRDWLSLNVKKTVWAPQEISNDAECVPLKTKLSSKIFFPDESTIAQIIHINKTDPASLILRGYYPKGKVKWDEDNRAIVFSSDDYNAVIALNRGAKWIGASPSCVKALTGILDPGADSGMWAVEIQNVKAGDDIILAARFSPANNRKEDIISQAVKMTDKRLFMQMLENRESAWNNLLAKVPQPSDFNMHTQKSRGVTADQVRKAYYRAWVFLIQDILPAMPDNDYPYPQVTCGKPALWCEGHEKAKGSAQWESIVAMQFTACVDPESTWKSFEGLMTLVDENGTMGGEGLPSRHAQTAWTLYNQTGDIDRLRQCYPAMKRLLQWKVDDPRWVYKGLTSYGIKDIEFVYHALMDMKYMQRITDILGMPEETSYWQVQIDTLADNMRQWFWDQPGGPTYRIYDENSKVRSGPDNSWVIPAIVLPSDILHRSERSSLVRLFNSSINQDTPFLIWNITKHPSLSNTIRGAYQYGMINEANDLTEAIMRDIAAAGEFSECYQQSFPPVTTGVTPSNFGAMNIIDAALWRNGIMYGDGLPVIVRFPGSSGVRNLSVRGRMISVSFDKTGDGLELSGEGLDLLKLPVNFNAITANGKIHWRGILHNGGQLRLEYID